MRLLGCRAADMDVCRQDVTASNEGEPEQDMVNVEVVVGHCWKELLSLLVGIVELHWVRVVAGCVESSSIRLIVVIVIDAVFGDSFL